MSENAFFSVTGHHHYVGHGVQERARDIAQGVVAKLVEAKIPATLDSSVDPYIIMVTSPYYLTPRPYFTIIEERLGKLVVKLAEVWLDGRGPYRETERFEIGVHMGSGKAISRLFPKLKARYEAELKFVEDNKRKEWSRGIMKAVLERIQKRFPEYAQNLSLDVDQRVVFSYTVEKAEDIESLLGVIKAAGIQPSKIPQ
jgi:hypothetical protein